jgi:hypothetical protein
MSLLCATTGKRQQYAKSQILGVKDHEYTTKRPLQRGQFCALRQPATSASADQQFSIGREFIRGLPVEVGFKATYPLTDADLPVSVAKPRRAAGRNRRE